MSDLKSSCCQADMWVICGDLKLHPEDQHLVPYGKTCFYECGKCGKPCDSWNTILD